MQIQEFWLDGGRPLLKVVLFELPTKQVRRLTLFARTHASLLLITSCCVIQAILHIKHHLLYDGYSNPIIAADEAMAYLQLSKGLPVVVCCFAVFLQHKNSQIKYAGAVAEANR